MRIYTLRGALLRGLLFSELVAVLFFFAGCSKSDEPTRLRSLGLSDEQIVSYKKGRVVYISACISCHNPNPQLDGSIGPAVYGSSLELLESKVVHGTYPAGYKPKRETGLMPKFPQFSADLEALRIFLSTKNEN